MNQFMIFAIAMGIVIVIGFFFNIRPKLQQKKAIKKTANKHNLYRLRNPNIRRVK